MSTQDEASGTTRIYSIVPGLHAEADEGITNDASVSSCTAHEMTIAALASLDSHYATLGYLIS